MRDHALFPINPSCPIFLFPPSSSAIFPGFWKSGSQYVPSSHRHTSCSEAGSPDSLIHNRKLCLNDYHYLPQLAWIDRKMCLNDYHYLPQLAWIVVSCSPCNCPILVMPYLHITILFKPDPHSIRKLWYHDIFKIVMNIRRANHLCQAKMDTKERPWKPYKGETLKNFKICKENQVVRQKIKRTQVKR